MVTDFVASDDPEKVKPSRVLWMERVDVDENGKEIVSEPLRTTDKQWLGQYAARGNFRLTKRRPAAAKVRPPTDKDFADFLADE